MINMMMMLMITAGLESAAAAAGQLDVGRTRRRSNLVDATRHRRRATGRRSTHRSATAVRRPTAALSTPTQHSWTTTTQVKRSRQQCVCVCVCVCVQVKRSRQQGSRRYQTPRRPRTSLFRGGSTPDMELGHWVIWVIFHVRVTGSSF